MAAVVIEVEGELVALIRKAPKAERSRPGSVGARHG